VVSKTLKEFEMLWNIGSTLVTSYELNSTVKQRLQISLLAGRGTRRE
jgi:hypothetical protein